MPSSNQYPDNWDKIRKRVYERDGYRCQSCGAGGGPNGETTLHAHHKTSIAAGGSHRMSNLITLCPACHNDEHEHNIQARTSPEIGQSNSKKPWAQDAYSHIPDDVHPFEESASIASEVQTDPEPFKIFLGMMLFLLIGVIAVVNWKIITSAIIAFIILYAMTH